MAQTGGTSGQEKAYAPKLVFKSGTTKLTKDAQSVCQLLSIDPTDLIPRSISSFKEEGLPMIRQQLRHEHFEEKRVLKIRAVENVLLRIQSKDDSMESMQVQMLLQDIKKQDSRQRSGFMTTPVRQRGRSEMQKQWQSTQVNNLVSQQQNSPMASPDLSNLDPNQLQITNPISMRRLYRSIHKMDRWNATQENIQRLRMNHDQLIKDKKKQQEKKWKSYEKEFQKVTKEKKDRMTKEMTVWKDKVENQVKVRKDEEMRNFAASKKAAKIEQSCHEYAHHQLQCNTPTTWMEKRTAKEAIERNELDHKFRKDEEVKRQRRLELDQLDHTMFLDGLKTCEQLTKRTQLAEIKQKKHISNIKTKAFSMDNPAVAEAKREEKNQQLKNHHMHVLTNLITKETKLQEGIKKKEKRRLEEIKDSKLNRLEMYYRIENIRRNEKDQIKDKAIIIKEKDVAKEQMLQQQKKSIQDQIQQRAELRNLMKQDADEVVKQKQMQQEMKKMRVIRKHEYKDKFLSESKQRQAQVLTQTSPAAVLNNGQFGTTLQSP